jgi:hypothetical protein
MQIMVPTKMQLLLAFVGCKALNKLTIAEQLQNNLTWMQKFLTIEM